MLCRLNKGILEKLKLREAAARLAWVPQALLLRSEGNVERSCAARVVTMRAWPVARSIFDAPLCERSERGDNKLDNARSTLGPRCVEPE